MNLFSRRQLLRLGAAASAVPFFVNAQSTQDKRLGIALLGLGDYATNQLAPAIMKARNARLAGVVTGSPEKAGRWQKDYKIPDGNVYNYENIDSIADNKDIDIVYVVTPTGLHADFAVRAAKAGKHVICEKPMAPTVADCTRMIDAAKAAGVTLQIGYRLHWEPHHLRLREAVQKEEFGKWKSIAAADASVMKDFTGKNAWRIDKELGVAGALYDRGVYCVQAELYSAGIHPKQVTAKHSTQRKEHFTEVPETYEWSLEFPDGRKSESFASYGRNANYLRVAVEKGQIEIEPAYGYSGQKGSTPAGPMNLQDVHQQLLQIEGQVASILEGKPSRVPGEMGRRDIRILQGIMEAAETGKPFEFGKFAY